MMTYPDDDVFGPDEDWDHYDVYEDTVWNLRDAAIKAVKTQLDEAAPPRPARVAPTDSLSVSHFAPYIWRDALLMLDELASIVAAYQEPDGEMLKAQAPREYDDTILTGARAVIDDYLAHITHWRTKAARHGLWEAMSADDRDTFRTDFDRVDKSAEALGSHGDILAPREPNFKKEEFIADGLRTGAELGLDLEALYPGWVIDEIVPEHGVTPTKAQARRDFQWMYGPHQMMGYGNKILWAVADQKDKVMLFQLHTKGALDWANDGPTLQIWIARDDLKRRRFHKAFATIEHD